MDPLNAVPQLMLYTINDHYLEGIGKDCNSVSFLFLTCDVVKAVDEPELQTEPELLLPIDWNRMIPVHLP
jgi:hypothetical protein